MKLHLSSHSQVYADFGLGRNQASEIKSHLKNEVSMLNEIQAVWCIRLRHDAMKIQLKDNYV